MAFTAFFVVHKNYENGVISLTANGVFFSDRDARQRAINLNAREDSYFWDLDLNRVVIDNNTKFAVPKEVWESLTPKQRAALR